MDQLHNRRFSLDARTAIIVIGFTCYNVWVENVASCLCLFGGNSSLGIFADPSVFRMTYCTLAGLLSFSICLKSDRVFEFLLGPWPGRLTGLSIVGLSPLLAAFVGTWLPAGSFLLASLVTGACLVLFISWAIVLGSLSLPTLFPCLALTFCLGSLLPAFAPQGHALLTVAGCALFGIASFFLLLLARNIEPTPVSEEKASPFSQTAHEANSNRKATWRVIVRFSLCLFIWMAVLRATRAALNVPGLQSGMVSSEMSLGASLLLSLLFVAVAMLLFAFPSQFKLEWVYRFLFLLAVAVVLLALPVLAAFVPRWLVSSLDFSALQLFAMVMWSVEAALSTNRSINPYRMATFCSGLWPLGSACGLAFSQALAASSAEGISLVLVCLTLILASCYVLVFTEHDVALLTEAIPEMQRRPFKERCISIGKQYRLTDREIEIMAYVAMGRDTPYIQEALCLSKNTVNFHRKNLYAKLGIHSKQELLDLVKAHPLRTR